MIYVLLQAIKFFISNAHTHKINCNHSNLIHFLCPSYILVIPTYNRMIRRLPCLDASTFLGRPRVWVG